MREVAGKVKRPAPPAGGRSGFSTQIPGSRASHGGMESTVPALDTKNLCTFEKKKKGKNIYNKNYLNV